MLYDAIHKMLVDNLGAEFEVEVRGDGQFGLRTRDTRLCFGCKLDKASNTAVVHGLGADSSTIDLANPGFRDELCKAVRSCRVMLDHSVAMEELLPRPVRLQISLRMGRIVHRYLAGQYADTAGVKFVEDSETVIAGEERPFSVVGCGRDEKFGEHWMYRIHYLASGALVLFGVWGHDDWSIEDMVLYGRPDFYERLSQLIGP